MPLTYLHIFGSLLSFRKERRKENRHTRSSCYVYSPFQVLKQLTDFHEIWYELYGIEDYINLLLFISGIVEMLTLEMGAELASLNVGS